MILPEDDLGGGIAGIVGRDGREGGEEDKKSQGKGEEDVCVVTSMMNGRDERKNDQYGEDDEKAIDWGNETRNL